MLQLGIPLSSGPAPLTHWFPVKLSHSRVSFKVPSLESVNQIVPHTCLPSQTFSVISPETLDFNINFNKTLKSTLLYDHTRSFAHSQMLIQSCC